MNKYKIVEKNRLAENVNEYVIFAPFVAKHCLAGQFIILRTDGKGERVPFTICDYDRKLGLVKILVQEIGYTTMQLAQMNIGDCLADFCGPLGVPTDLSEYQNILLVGGGIGTAVIFPQAKQLKADNKNVDTIVGARDDSLLMYIDEFMTYSDNLYIVTDNGTVGDKGLVTDKIASLINFGKKYDCVFAVGPLPMMRAVCALTKKYGIKTVVSMNSVMVDGTGMCGCCRLMVGDKIKYACIDGPEFDGHLVDFDEAISRSKNYVEKERKVAEDYKCKLKGGSCGQ